MRASTAPTSVREHGAGRGRTLLSPNEDCDGKGATNSTRGGAHKSRVGYRHRAEQRRVFGLVAVADGCQRFGRAEIGACAVR